MLKYVIYGFISHKFKKLSVKRLVTHKKGVIMTKTIQSRSAASLHKPENDLTLIKRIENKESKIRNTALIIKVSTITITCILLAFISISIFSIHSMKTTSQKLANTIGVEKVDNDIEKLINTNIVKYIIKMTAITLIILLVLVVSFGLGYKLKLFSQKGR